MSILDSFLQFIKKPDYHVSYDKGNWRFCAWNIIKLWSFIGLIIFFAETLITEIIDYVGFDLTQNHLIDFFSEQSSLAIIFFALIFAPIFEEVIFRLPMKYSYRNFGFSLAVIFVFSSLELLGYASDGFNEWISSANVFAKNFIFIFIILGLGIVFGELIRQKFHQEKISNFYEKYFKWIFYILTLAFGVVHIMNFFNYSAYWYLVILLVFPQLLISFGLGFIRMIFGFRWSVFMHFFHNTVFTLPILIFSYLSSDIMSALTEGEDFDVETLSQSDQIILFLSSWYMLAIIILFLLAIFSIFREYYLFRKLKTKKG